LIPPAWGVGDRAEAAAQDVVVTVTPGAQRVIFFSDLCPGQHLAVLGADAQGKAGVELAALDRCRLAGRSEGRRSAEEITLFDSTGLAIQDLAIAIAVFNAWSEGRVEGRPAAL
jgi:ornithine cyclodeaminase/alanine dehydrogenase-like protein (mu-crystallin family)